RGREGGAPVQDPLVVEDDERFAAETHFQLETRIAQQRGKAPVGAIEGGQIPRAQCQGCDGAAIVVHGRDRPVRGQLNQRAFRVQIGVGGSIVEGRRGGGGVREVIR